MRFVQSQSETTPPLVWSYRARHTTGAFRAIKVDHLLHSPAKISLYEWPTIKFPSATVGSDLNAINPPYIAISHVWDYGDEVNSASYRYGSMVRKLKVRIKSSPGHKDISWKGLVQIAHAAVQLNAEWIWLDFLCINQKPVGRRSEMPQQICIMRDIYENASSVVVMIGGIPQVQSVGRRTAWMDRAWTLQESYVNWQQTWVYVKWPGPTGTTDIQDDRGRRHPLLPVAREPYTRLIRLKVLLDMADRSFSMPPYTNVRVLDGMFAAPGRGEVPRHAFRTAIHPNRLVSAAGIWRSMFLRTSTHPVDIVYSVMLCFNLQIDPFRDIRTYKDLFRDLARKTAAISSIGPAWLTINGVAGSRFPRDPISHVIPRCPDTTADDRPVYSRGISRTWVGRYVDAYDDYIDRWDIIFVTHSHPHIINACLFPFGLSSNFRIINRSRRIAMISLNTIRGKLYYRAPALEHSSTNVQIVYVGRVGDSRIGARATYPGGRFVLFIKWDPSIGRWNVLGDGVFMPRRRSSFRKPRSRWIFTVGEGAQTVKDKWLSQRLVGNYPLDRWAIRRFKYHDYGVVPVKDWRYPRAPDKLISWVGAKPLPVRQEKWYKQEIKFRLAGLSPNAIKSRFKRPGWLGLVSGMGDRPATISTPTTTQLTKMGSLRMNYAYREWRKAVCARLARAGLEGILVPKKDSLGISTANYYVAVIYGEYMIYLMSKPSRETRWEYTEISVIPYRKANRPIINKAYVIEPTPQPQGPDPLSWAEYQAGLQQQWIVLQQAAARQRIAFAIQQRIALAMRLRCAPRVYCYSRC